MSTWSVYKEVCPPTSVDLCVSGNFTGKDHHNLFVSKSHVLELYRVRYRGARTSALVVNDDAAYFSAAEAAARRQQSSAAAGVASGGQGDGETGRGGEVEVRLELVGSWPLHGTPTSMCPLLHPVTRTHHLMLSFRDAKASVVAFDPALGSLRTTSMHYMEDADKLSVFTGRVPKPKIVSDPGGRCAGAFVYGDVLALLRTKKDATGYEENEGADGGGDGPGGGQWTAAVAGRLMVQLKDLGLKHVRDLAFLHGYYEPTLCVLWDEVPSWVGVRSVQHHTCRITAFSITMGDDQARPVAVWSASGIPSNAHQIVPLPNGGMLCVCTNCIIYVNQSQRVGLAVNEFHKDDKSQPDVAPLPLAEGVIKAAKAMQESFGGERAGDRDAVSLTGRVELDGAKCTVLGKKKVLVSLKAGELYLVTLVTDMTNAVRSLDLNRVGASVICSCMATISQRKDVGGYVFLGSRAGDSLVLSYSTQEIAATALADAPPVGAKRSRGAAGGGAHAGEELAEGGNPSKASRAPVDVEDAVGGDALDTVLYTSSTRNVAAGAADQTSFRFRICDALPNLGPIRDFTIGEMSPLDDDLALGKEKALLEKAGFPPHEVRRNRWQFAAAVGRGRQGAVQLFQRGCRPEVLVTVEIPGCCAAFSLFHGSGTGREEDMQHRYLLLTVRGEGDGRDAGSTMVLEATEDGELNEITDSAQHITNEMTLFAGNIDVAGGRILQVTPRAALVLNGTTKEYELALPKGVAKGTEYSAVSAVKQYVLFLLSSGQVCLSEPSAKGDKLKNPVLVRAKEMDTSTCTSVCLIDAGLNRLSWLGNALNLNKFAADVETANLEKLVADKSAGDGEAEDEEDEEAMLYGESSKKAKPDPVGAGAAPALNFSEDAKEEQDDSSLVMALLFLKNGTTEIRSVPDMELLWSTVDLSQGRPVLEPSPEGADQAKGLASSPCEAVSIDLGQKGKQPPLLIVRFAKPPTDEAVPSPASWLADGSSSVVMAYRGFCQQTTQGGTVRNILRFHREQWAVDFAVGSKSQNNGPGSRLLAAFTSVGGYHGAVVCGARPWWVFPSKGQVSCHPQLDVGGEEDGGVVSFAPFNSASSPHGFVHITGTGTVQICTLPSDSVFSAPLPWRKVPMKEDVHKITYLPDHRCYAVAVSAPALDKIDVIAEGDMIGGDDGTGDGAGIDTPWRSQHFEVRLYSTTLPGAGGASFGTISNHPSSIPGFELVWNLKLKELEHVLCIKSVQLKEVPGSTPGPNEPYDPGPLRPFLVVGTAFMAGEDRPIRGRILLLDVQRQAMIDPTTRTSLSKIDASIVVEKELKMPVTSIVHLDGYLGIANGSKVNVFSWTGTELVGAAFFDCQYHVTCVSVVKNYILATDAMKGCYFLRWTERVRILTLLGRDMEPMPSLAAGFIVDGSGLGLVTSGLGGNLGFFEYDPRDIDSMDGQRLMLKAHFCISGSGDSDIYAMEKLRCPGQDEKFCLYFGTTRGSIGGICPINEVTFKRLRALQEALNTHLPHIGGLNPRAHRQPARQLGVQRRAAALAAQVAGGQGSCVDGPLIEEFHYLPTDEQEAVCRYIGTTRQLVLRSLQEVQDWTMVF